MRLDLSRVKVPLRAKVLSVFLTTVVFILLLSNALFYLSTEHTLINNAIGQNKVVVDEIDAQIHDSEVGTAFIERLIGNELRIASIAAKYALPSEASQVKNAQLSALAHEMGISQITLLARQNNDIVGVKSSDPAEIGMSTKGMGLWYDAFVQLFTKKNVTLNYGQSAPNYWTGPWSNAASNPALVDKWGYFYDGTTNYIIDPFVEASYIQAYSNAIGPSALVATIQQDNPNILDITGFNPRTFGKSPVVWSLNGRSWVDITNQPIVFGNDKFADGARDIAAIRQAYDKHSVVSFRDTINHQEVLKTFIPATDGAIPYVVGFVTSYAMIHTVLSSQLKNSSLISIGLLLVVILISYIASGYIVKPLQRISRKVAQISDIQFDQPMAIHRNDEIGQLAQQVNTMSENLVDHLQRSLREERTTGMAYLGTFTAALIHELRNPVSALKNLLEMFPRVYPVEGKGQDVLHHMQLASDHVTSIVDGFSEFIRNGKLNIELKNLHEIAVDAVKMVSTMADERKVTIEIHADVPSLSSRIPIDGDKIRLVLINLLTNAMEAIDPEATERRVVIELCEGKSDYTLDVTDTGHGISEDQQADLFKPFHTTKRTGFGLGLSLCNFIVLSSGGTLSVKSSSHEGTTMRIVLPKEVDDL